MPAARPGRAAGAPPVDGPAWRGFARDAAARGEQRDRDPGPRTASPGRRRSTWRRRSANGALLIHYGSPVVTSHNTVVVPVKTGATGGFRHRGALGHQRRPDLVGRPATTSLPAHNWVPSYNLALTAANRLYAPGAGGKLLVKDDADAAGGALQHGRLLRRRGLQRRAGGVRCRASSSTRRSPSTRRATSSSASSSRRQRRRASSAASPAIGANGVGSWVSAAAAAGDAGDRQGGDEQRAGALARREARCTSRSTPRGRRRGASAATCSRSTARRSRSRARCCCSIPPSARRPRDQRRRDRLADGRPRRRRLLRRPRDRPSARTTRRGWLLHFDATLATQTVPGGFGWDDTASVVPASMVPSYTGGSSYLLMTKYNNYAGVGAATASTGSRCSIRSASQTDPITGAAGHEGGPDDRSARPSSRAPRAPVKEWCINTAAVDPLTKSILVNSEDGNLYRWDLATNRLTPADPADQRHRRGVHADGDRRRRRGLRDQQRGAVLDRRKCRRRSRPRLSRGARRASAASRRGAARARRRSRRSPLKRAGFS